MKSPVSTLDRIARRTYLGVDEPTCELRRCSLGMRDRQLLAAACISCHCDCARGLGGIDIASFVAASGGGVSSEGRGYQVARPLSGLARRHDSRLFGRTCCSRCGTPISCLEPANEGPAAISVPVGRVRAQGRATCASRCCHCMGMGSGYFLGLFVSACLYWRGATDEHGIRRWERWCYWAGWWSLVIALVSPLHPMGEVLFSAHMVQHEILMLVAAPLLVLGRPLAVSLGYADGMEKRCGQRQ